ncbi:TPA: dolichol kinase [Candidatus Geothermarchaeota archaeon]|nr:dolichol kinase [Candidatus Geothermarchaeota archaeon]
MEEVIASAILLIYVSIIVFVLTKKLYELYVDRVGDMRMRYYNRKIIHIFAGGVVALLVPYIYSGPLIPFILGVLLAISVLIPYLRGKIYEWFQVPDNMYDVNFCLVWGVLFPISYYVWGDMTYAVVLISFMAFGDAATGLIRNYLFKRRTKHWIGNIAMYLVSAPIAIYYLGWIGILVALVASIAEHFEYKWIDDNVLVPTSAFITLYILAGL